MKTEKLPELKAELLLDHEITGPYSLDDPTAALEIMAQNIPDIKPFMTGSELFAQTDPAEWAGVTDATQRNEWLNLCAIEKLTVENNGLVHQTVQTVFGAGQTRNNLVAYRTILVTRASQLKWGVIHGGDVESARALP